jgi:ribonucleotide reductase alpha subunit
MTKYIETLQMDEFIDVTMDDINIFLNKFDIEKSNVDIELLTKNIFDTMPNTKITKNEFYNYVADLCVSKSSYHFEYNKLASMICVERIHLITDDDILIALNKSIYGLSDDKEINNEIYEDDTLDENLMNFIKLSIDIKTTNQKCAISKELLKIIEDNHDEIVKKIDCKRDYLFDYFGIKTLERSYLKKIKDYKTGKKIIIERPQYMIMRVALGIHGSNLELAFETYDLISYRYFTHATPTLFNAGTDKPQLSSCFLLSIDDDLKNVFEKIDEMAQISKWAGGVGVNLSYIRSKNTIIAGTDGISDGILPLCITLNKVAKYVNQGGKRAGSFAIYLEPWHADIYDFYDLRKQNSGNEDNRARDLFLASWIPDLFMKRVLANDMWSLMCPHECKGLVDTYGEEFEKLYETYEKMGLYKKRVLARDLWQHMCISQIETGFPYMLYKDHVNRKSNQKNLGTIKSSNLCVHYNTFVLTDKGYIKIGDNVDKQFNIWNGREWSSVVFKKTADNKDLLRINVSDGNFIDCTPEHKFHIYENGLTTTKIVQASELKIGDKIIKMDKTPIFKNNIILYNDVNEIQYVVSIEESYNNVSTYCLTEPLRNMAVFNGILTNNCAEIVEYTDSKTTAVCNLASICLPRFIENNKFNFNKLIDVCKVIVTNLNKIIDINYYTSDFAKLSNLRNRPIGIGVQGLADVYNILGYSYDSDEAILLNKQIFEVIYYGCLKQSMELAKIDGKYETFDGSPFSEGKLQFHLWDSHELLMADICDWPTLINDIIKFGTRNSLLTALMPTAGTSQIMKCYESFEPYITNVFVRTTLAGEFIVINDNLMKDLIKLNLWNDDMRKLIIIKNGSIQDIGVIPKHIKNIYKTAFELDLKTLIDQSVARGKFIDQTQSMNLFMDAPNYQRLLSAHFHAWENGLKTGMYYLRTTPAVNPIQFGIDISDVMRLTNTTNISSIINNEYGLKNKKEDKYDDDDDDEVYKVCKFDPSKLAEGCFMCSG